MRARPRTIHGIDLTQPDGITRLLEYRRSLHGNATMTAPTGEQQTSGEQGSEGQQTGQSTESGQPGGQTSTPEAKFTQADLDRILGERLASEKTKHDQALKQAQELAGKNETEKLTIERDQATQRAQEATQKAAERVAKTEAKVAAIAAGANPDRLAAIVRNADLTAAVKDGEVDEAAVKAAIDAVLTEYPEWKKAHTGPSSSGGELNGSESGKPSFTRAQIEAMSPDERVRRIEEINDAMANGRITG
jgi:hypothetical protein